jgi:hypothetical protein
MKLACRNYFKTPTKFAYSFSEFDSWQKKTAKNMHKRKGEDLESQPKRPKQTELEQPLDRLPQELILLLVSFLDVPTQVSFSHSCHRHLQLLEVWSALPYLTTKQNTRTDQFFVECAKLGYLTLLQWDFGPGYRHHFPLAVLKAAKYGQLDILRCCCKSFPLAILAEPLCYRAARGGHEAVLNWLERSYAFKPTSAALGAAFGGHLEIFSRYCQGPDEMFAFSAASNGQIKILEWMLAQGYFVFTERVSIIAFLNGQLSTLQWLKSHGCPCEENLDIY